MGINEHLTQPSYLEQKAEEDALKNHEADSISLMLYTLLLIVTVLTTWLFKHKKFKFVHETGVTLIYGAIVGFFLWVSGRFTRPHSPVAVVLKNQTQQLIDFPLYIQFQIHNFSYPYLLQDSHGTPIDGTPMAMKTPSFIEQTTTFKSEIFYNILLPPIIFNAGYGLKKKQFFRNIGSIMVFAFIGTTISAFFVGYFLWGMVSLIDDTGLFTISEMLYFGGLISATDPVTTLAIFHDLGVEMDLYAIVFGESVLNDAVAIVFTGTIDDYMPSASTIAADDSKEVTFLGILGAVGHFFAVFGGSFLLGVLGGCCCALFTKFTKISEYPIFETALFLLMSYLSFLVAEVCGMTGIVSVLFCGMCQAHYTYNNLSTESQNRTKQFFEAINFLSEAFIFTYIGVSLFTSHTPGFDFIFNAYVTFFALVAIVLARMLHIYGLSFLLNLKRKPPISAAYQHMLVFSGLRGAIAYALAIRNKTTEARQQLYMTTSVIVAFTVVVNGGLTKWMIEKLGIRSGITSDRETQPVVTQTQRSEPEGAPGYERSPHHHYNPWDKAALPRKWYNFDTNYVKPMLTNSRPTLMETLPEVLQPVARLFTTTEQLMNSPLPVLPDPEARRKVTLGRYGYGTVDEPDPYEQIGGRSYSPSADDKNMNSTSSTRPPADAELDGLDPNDVHIASRVSGDANGSGSGGDSDDDGRLPPPPRRTNNGYGTLLV